VSARRAWDRYDESDAKVRTTRRSRPRSKNRPRHDDAEPGVVVTIDRGRYTCLVGGLNDADNPARVLVTAAQARELGRRSVVVGDEVDIVGDVSGRAGTLARIVRVRPRRTTLRRTADDTDPYERVVVANAEQMLMVTSVADPEPRPRLIDRCLVAAFDAGIEPMLCLTKTDLADPAEMIETYVPLQVTTVTVGHLPEGGADLSAIKELLAGHVTVLVGHSGVGKSSLVNALVPGSSRSVGQVSATTGRGRHTSTSAYALELPSGGWVVDTPGIRSFGLAHVDPTRLVSAFPDLREATTSCPRGCRHDSEEPECGLDAAVRAGTVDAGRVDSFRRLLSSREQRPGDEEP